MSVPCTEYTEYLCVLYGSHNTQRSFLYTQLIDRFLGALVKIEKIDCQVRCVSLSFRMKQLGFHLTDFLKFDIWVFF